LPGYKREGCGFLKCIVTGKESCLHYFQPETKPSSKGWQHSSSPKLKNFCMQASAGTVILMLFWDCQGPLVQHYMCKGATVTNAVIVTSSSGSTTRSKHYGLLSTIVLLQHDNCTLHTAYVTAEAIKVIPFECFPHPPYSLDLTPCGCPVFRPGKEVPGGRGL
jgi:histone-lysine N-methyltransferase SETMAR